ncbi:DegT/DnrJ/EryC1/StrS family aminotransferase [Ampullimonas aquatilis]|uniref:DegT/DnrJ/EryC1/StrS family aminotransferase n=1 Tax=Ampullimonas aquatilis TaxID=1341549 RepID=UPI003C71C96B
MSEDINSKAADNQAKDHDNDDYLDDDGWIPLSDPDITQFDIDFVSAALQAPQLSNGPLVEKFEQVFAKYIGRKHGIAVASGTIGVWLALQTLELQADDEVIVPAYSWHQTAHAVLLTGAKPVFADIDYWCGCLAPEAIAAKITDKTKALLVCNANGHPAAWQPIQELAAKHNLRLIEDSTEAIGSRYQGKVVGSFGDLAIFDFSQPSAMCAGEGAIILTDDDALASELHYFRNRKIEDRSSISVGSRVPLQACISEMTAALALAQLNRIDDILARRKQVQAWYLDQLQTFEGIKPPYLAPDVDEVHWMFYLVHLGKRFTTSARGQVIEDMDAELIETAAYCMPLHQQFAYQKLGYKRGQLPNTERIGDRALALPFNTHLTENHVKFIVKRLKEASINIGAGVPIY